MSTGSKFCVEYLDPCCEPAFLQFHFFCPVAVKLGKPVFFSVEMEHGGGVIKNCNRLFFIMLYFSPLFNNILTDKSLYKQSHYKRILGIFQKDPGQGDIRPYIFNFIVNIFKFQRRISVVMSCPDGRFKEIVGPECGICRMTGIPRLPEIIDTSRFWADPGLG